MRIVVKLLSDETIFLNVYPTHTIGYVKNLIGMNKGLKIKYIMLSGKELEDTETLDSYGITPASKLYAIESVVEDYCAGYGGMLAEQCPQNGGKKIRRRKTKRRKYARRRLSKKKKSKNKKKKTKRRRRR